MSRLWLMRAIACSIPFLFFIFLELGLRLFDYGSDHRLFIENPQAPQYLLPRPDVVKRYFAARAEVPPVTIETNFFKKQKPKDGLRIFVQGGSTAAGFPFGLGASIAGMLDYRLKQSFPDRPVEVINTALSAVNSFTLIDFSDEIIEQAPDAIVIYAGHNEYLGVLGVGSSYSVAGSYGSTLLFLKLRHLRLFQLLQAGYISAAGLLGKKRESGGGEARTTMAKIAKHKNIPKDSALYDAGKKQFTNNLSILLKKYQKAKIPVFIATIASNLEDQRPFASASLSDDKREQADAFLRLPLGDKKFENEKWLLSMEALAREAQSAELFFRLGQISYRFGRLDQAKEYFQRARDHDLLRFRAPTEFNSIIVAAAKQYQATLVDVNASFEAQAPDGLIGSELMLEHLHPNVEGYFLIADAFYEAIANQASNDNASDDLHAFHGLSNYQNAVEARRELPVFAAEEYWGIAKIADLTSDYPFTKNKQAAKLPEIKTWSDKLGYKAYQNKAGWIEIATQTLKHSKSDVTTQIIALKLLSDAVPYSPDYANQAGVGLIRLGRPVEAPRYLKRAIELDPTNTNYQLALVHALLLQKRVVEAQAWTQKILAIDPDNVMAKEVADKTGITP